MSRGVLGERKFDKEQWQCSILDSVVGAFLTQNVTDALSSKAFMNMVAIFPPKGEKFIRSCISLPSKFFHCSP